MDPQLAPNVKFFEHDRPPKTPKLSMEIESSMVVFVENTIGPLATIRRAEDDCNDPCIFRWSVEPDGWGPSGFMLFQHTSEGLKEVIVKQKSPPPQIFKLTGPNYIVETEELLPGQCFQRRMDFPESFKNHLIAGEKYELFWPGAEYSLWAWGTLRQHWDQGIGVNLELPHAVIPGGARCSVTFEKMKELTPSERDGPRVEKSQRIPGTPCISVFLEAPTTISKKEGIYVTAKISYDGLTNENYDAVHANSKPIIIHKYGFEHDHFRLQRRCHDHDKSQDTDEDRPRWESYYDEERDSNRGWIMVDDPDVEVNVTDPEWFRSLQPGETFIDKFWISFEDMHPDTVVGDTYRYKYWGGCIDWWNWGDCEEHANTVVKLPCWMHHHVVDPADNDGRPLIYVTSSNSVEFTVVD